MAELRRDSIGGRWVIVDTDHPNKPEEYDHDRHVSIGGNCPFCYGNESMTPLEIDSIRDPLTGRNTAGWQVRVVPNKYPALQIEGQLDRRGVGIYDMSNGVGAHEILVETPYHFKDIPDLLDEEVALIIEMSCRRVIDLKKDRRFKYIMLFKNYGAAAGASLEHPHTQIIALPMVPKNVMEEIKGARHYFDFRERCIFCDMIRQEIQEKARIISQNASFLAFCPFVSRFPFEIWIIPKEHASYYCAMSSEKIRELAVILKDTVRRVKSVFPECAYNFIVHSSPVNGDSDNVEDYHWHIEFMPKLTRVAGFEWGTGFYAVSTSPEEAAKYLLNVQ